MKHLALKPVAEVRTCGLTQHTWVWAKKDGSKEPPLGAICQCEQMEWTSAGVKARD